MNKLFRKIFLGVLSFTMLLLITSASAISADEASLDVLQLQLLRGFLENVTNPKTRTGFEDVLNGGILDTQFRSLLSPDGEFDNSFMVGVINYDDMLNYELKEMLSSATGIPSSRIVFFWMDLENVRHEPLTLHQWHTYYADIMLDTFKDKPTEKVVGILADEAITAKELLDSNNGTWRD
ncbi:MAG: hypothetical protein FWC76_01560 [Defluviitaleaceae bacterium]|nr:hypothetical protein [Defluviitaleaceae bacterium]